ncbi:MAG TPA: signal peptidase I [Terriglobales bacterium]|jgi:signal peptidase I|nr:signal peptidase I [Terriglobales bacterium]
MSDPSSPSNSSTETSEPQNQPAAQPEFLHGADRFQPDIAEGATPAPDPQHSTRPRKQQESWLGLLQSLLVVVVIALFVVTFLIQAFQIPSGSMENTLLVGDYVMVDKVRFGEGGIWNNVLPYSPIWHGDIIVFKYPINPSLHYVKRVIGLPGDRVRMENKNVWVNGKLLHEGYTIYQTGGRGSFPSDSLYEHTNGSWTTQLPNFVRGDELVVPPGSYFVLGDNRDDSEDSRFWGFVPRENIEGRPWLVYFSFAASPVGTEEAQAADGKLAGLIFTVRHLWEYVRWNRVMRLVQ